MSKNDLDLAFIDEKVKLPSFGQIGWYYFRFIRICSSNVGMQKFKLYALIRIMLEN